MDEGERARAAWPELVGVVAAAAVGLVVAADGFPLAIFAVFTDVLVRGPMGPGVYAAAVLAAAIAVPALLPRLPGWPVAAAGLAVYLAGDLTAADEVMVLLPVEPGTTREVAIALIVTAGLGLALGGVLLAIAQASPATSWWTGAGLAAGLALHPVGTELFRAVLPRRAEYPPLAPTTQPGTVDSVDVQLWLALGLVVVAAVVAYSRRSGNGLVGSARFRLGAPVAVIAVAALLLLGLALRMGRIRQFLLSAGERARPDRTEELFAQVSAVVLAAVAALLLTAYAYRLGRAPAARWVVLGAAAAPIVGFTYPETGRWSATRTALVLLFGLLAVAGGALAGRHAARVLPWDALGLVVAAAATALIWPVVRADLPSADTVGPVLVTVGLGLALGSGIVLATASAGTPPAGLTATVNGAVDSPAVGPAGDPTAGPADAPADAPPGEPTGGRSRDRSVDRAGVLVLGPAALMLCATALAPVVLRAQVDGLTEPGPSFTLPLFTTVGAGLLVVLFGFGRAVDRLRPDVRAEAVASAS